ncbi:MAG: hypothetical protein IPJ65_26750 [Archangiaceae bacterium]|nr:hypothetical protein [Archangiaceae bacterium]
MLRGQGRSEAKQPGPLAGRDWSTVDWAHESKTIERVLKGEQVEGSPWSALAKYSTPDWQHVLAEMRREAQTFTPEHVDQFVALAFDTVLTRHLNASDAVNAYVGRLKPSLERGAIVHGYGHHLAVPEGADHGTLIDVARFLPLLQGQSPATTTLGKARDKAIQWLVSHPATRRVGHQLEGEGLAFNRMMLTPIKKDDGEDQGYSMTSLTEVHERLGGNPAYEHLMAEGIERDLEVILDSIKNHNSYLHARSIELMDGDLDRLAEHRSFTGCAKVGELVPDQGMTRGQTLSLILHTDPKNAGALTQSWAIFKDNHRDGLFRVRVRLRDEYVKDGKLDVAKLQEKIGPSFAVDDTAKKALRDVYERAKAAGQVETRPDGSMWLADGFRAEIEQLRDENDARVLAGLEAAVARGKRPQLDLDVHITFKTVQFDKNMSNPTVAHEEMQADLIAALNGQSGGRDDAVIHVFQEPGTDGLNRPGAMAIMSFFVMMNDLMTPGRAIVPEAYVPNSDLQKILDATLELPGGREMAKSGNLGINFNAHTGANSDLRGEGLENYVRTLVEDWRPQDAKGLRVGTAVRAHDEAHVTYEKLQQMLSAGEVVDPIDTLELVAEQVADTGGRLGIDEACELLTRVLRENQKHGVLTIFEGRAAGDDPSTFLQGDPARIGLALAMSYASGEVPMISYRLLAQLGNNIEGTVDAFKTTLKMMEKEGQPLDFRGAFDSRILGRGPVPLRHWKKLLEDKDPVLARVRAMNQLWKTHDTFRSRFHHVMPTGNASTAAIARPGVNGKPALLTLLNNGDTAQTVTLSKAELAEKTGWAENSWKHAELRDLVAARMHVKGARPQERFEVADDGQGNLAVTLPPKSSVVLEKHQSRGAALAAGATRVVPAISGWAFSER